MSKASLELVYGGAAVKSGVMDSRDLAIALLSIGDLCQQANLFLNGQNVTVSVRVRAKFKKGSFGISFDVVRDVLGQAAPLLTHDNFQTAATLIKTLFGKKGVVALLKWMQGAKDSEAIQLSNGKTEIHIHGDNNRNNTFIVERNVYMMLDDPKLRKSIDGTLRPLQRAGMTSLAVKSGAKVIQTVKKKDVPFISFVPPNDSGMLDLKDETDTGGKVTDLEIVRLSFKRNNKWYFSDFRGRTLTATIEDKVFLQKVGCHKHSFGKGDKLRVVLKTHQVGKLNGRSRLEHSIIKVLEHIPSPQTEMFDPE